MSEGRKAFAERVEGIQSGAECERLASILSAVADGEAGAADVALLRPHLRTCLACRARLREYRDAPARVAGIAPPLVGAPLLASMRGLFDSATGWISERSASLAVRWHQAAELAAAHKVAAAAASAAVLAGGGVATVATVDAGDRPAAVRPTADSSAVPSPPPGLSGHERAGPRGATASSGGSMGHAAPTAETPPRGRDSAPSGRPADSRAAAPPAGEFTPDPAPAEPAATKPEQPARRASSAPESGEFSP